MRLKTRLGRLELARPAADPNEVPPYFWDVLGGAKKADDLPAAARARIEEWWPIRREESRRRRITAVRQMADTLRTDSRAD